MGSRILLAIFVGLVIGSPASAGSAKAPEPGTSVEMPYLIAPLLMGEELVAYAYITPKVIAASPAAAIDIREKTPFIQDAFVRDVNAVMIGSPDDPRKIDSAAVAARLLKDAQRVLGGKKVVSVQIVTIQVAEVRPGS